MIAIRVMASRARRGGAAATAGIAVALALAGCGVLPDKPRRATLYDFGPGLVVPAAAAAATPAVSSLPPLALAGIEANPRLDGTQLLYRLGYADPNELRSYGLARWSMAPAQLLGQRLRDALSARRTVLASDESAAVARTGGLAPETLHVTLEEFSHYFESPGASVGLVRLHATLLRGAPGGDRVLGQKSFTVRWPAPSPDAAGGVKALAAASDVAVAGIVQWVDGFR